MLANKKSRFYESGDGNTLGCKKTRLGQGCQLTTSIYELAINSFKGFTLVAYLGGSLWHNFYLREEIVCINFVPKKKMLCGKVFTMPARTKSNCTWLSDNSNLNTNFFHRLYHVTSKISNTNNSSTVGSMPNVSYGLLHASRNRLSTVCNSFRCLI